MPGTRSQRLTHQPHAFLSVRTGHHTWSFHVSALTPLPPLPPALTPTIRLPKNPLRLRSFRFASPFGKRLDRADPSLFISTKFYAFDVSRVRFNLRQKPS